MLSCSPLKTRAKPLLHFSGHFQKQMRSQTCNFVTLFPSSSCHLMLRQGNSRTRYSHLLVPSTSSSLSHCYFQAFRRPRYGFGISSNRGYYPSLTVKSSVSSKGSQETLIDFSSGCQNASVRILVPKRGRLPNFTYNVGPFSWSKGVSAGLISGLLVCYSTSDPVNAEAPKKNGDREECADASSVRFSHGKKVCTDYSVIGIPGDGRCLFRSVAHGACLRSGKPAPNETLQKELADELRARVADEFIRRRQETEWFIEGDFDTYISQIRKPHVWGGEPELLILSHVLRMPITVYMHDDKYGGLISIAEYGQEYGKDDPIRVLYHGFGHYDALQIPGKRGAKSRL